MEADTFLALNWCKVNIYSKTQQIEGSWSNMTWIPSNQYVMNIDNNIKVW